MQHDLKGEGAVVTGAASGICEAIATAFIEAGALLCDLSAKTRPSHFEVLDRH
jgi:NAD(P)-dependent dehydrogenase (short-subunit alcohol dehydrogenase family)